MAEDEFYEQSFDAAGTRSLATIMVAGATIASAGAFQLNCSGVVSARSKATNLLVIRPAPTARGKVHDAARAPWYFRAPHRENRGGRQWA